MEGVAAFSVAMDLLGTLLNYFSGEKTNETNEKLVDKMNVANAEQAELAYQRSKPLTQVENMRAAGMSKPAALQALSGGGSYTAPVMQSAQHQVPNFDISAAAERLASIPANSQQAALQRQQIKNLATQNESQIVDIQSKRVDIQQKEFDLARKRVEAARDEVVHSYFQKYLPDMEKCLTDSGAKSIQEFEDWMLDHNVELYNAYSASHALKEYADSSIASRRLSASTNANATKSEIEADVAKETKDVLVQQEKERLRGIKLGNRMTSKQIEQISDHIADFKAAKTAREKEYAVRAGRADLENLLNQRNLKLEDLRNQIYFDKDGKPNLAAETSVAWKEAWKYVMSVFGVEYLADILRGIVTIVPK